MKEIFVMVDVESVFCEIPEGLNCRILGFKVSNARKIDENEIPNGFVELLESKNDEKMGEGDFKNRICTFFTDRGIEELYDNDCEDACCPKTSVAASRYFRNNDGFEKSSQIVYAFDVDAYSKFVYLMKSNGNRLWQYTF